MKDRQITYLEKEEVESLLKVIKDPRDRAIFTITYYRGLRASEIGLLKLGDIRLTNGRIYVHRVKNSISGEYPMSPTELKYLRIWLKIREGKRWKDKGKDYLFPSYRGGVKLSGDSIIKLFKKYGKIAKIPSDKCHPHILKHSIATHLLSSGMEVATVQQWLGHRDIRNTMIYAKVTDKKMNEESKRVYNGEELAGV